MNKNIWLFFFLFLIVAGGCKNQQKIAEEAAAKAKAENIVKAKAILNSILDDDGQMTIDEKESKLRQARALNSDDPEVQQLIEQVEDALYQQREAEKMAAAKPPKPDASREQALSEMFENIASAGTTEAANSLIREGTEMFTSPQAPVLIIINRSGDLIDYDEPTTIQLYFNYLKDQQTSPNVIYDMVLDSNGKISELELIKKSKR